MIIWRSWGVWDYSLHCISYYTVCNIETGWAVHGMEWLWLRNLRAFLKRGSIPWQKQRVSFAPNLTYIFLNICFLICTEKNSFAYFCGSAKQQHFPPSPPLTDENPLSWSSHWPIKKYPVTLSWGWSEQSKVTGETEFPSLVWSLCPDLWGLESVCWQRWME